MGLVGRDGGDERYALAKVLVEDFAVQFADVAREVIQPGVVEGDSDLPHFHKSPKLGGIQREFLALPDATIVHSGHGPDTTIGAERVGNPFLVRAVRA